MPYGWFSTLCRRSLRTTSCWFDERRLVDRVEQVAHAVGFEPQRQLELIRRHGLEVVGAVVVGGAVDVAGAGGLEQPEVRVGAARASSPGTSCARRGGRNRCGRAPRWPADVVPEVHGDHRQPRFWLRITSRPLGSVILLERQARNVRRRAGAVLRRRVMRCRSRERRTTSTARTDASRDVVSCWHRDSSGYFHVERCRGSPTDTSTRPTGTAATLSPISINRSAVGVLRRPYAPAWP